MRSHTMQDHHAPLTTDQLIVPCWREFPPFAPNRRQFLALLFEHRSHGAVVAGERSDPIHVLNLTTSIAIGKKFRKAYHHLPLGQRWQKLKRVSAAKRAEPKRLENVGYAGCRDDFTPTDLR